MKNKVIFRIWIVLLGLAAFVFLCGGPLAIAFGNPSNHLIFCLYIGGASAAMLLLIGGWIFVAWGA